MMDPFFCFDIKESKKVTAIITQGGAVIIFLHYYFLLPEELVQICMENGCNEKKILLQQIIGHLNTYDFSVQWDEDEVDVNYLGKYKLKSIRNLKKEMLKCKLWPECLSALIRSYKIASVMLA